MPGLLSDAAVLAVLPDGMVKELQATPGSGCPIVGLNVRIVEFREGHGSRKLKPAQGLTQH